MCTFLQTEIGPFKFIVGTLNPIPAPLELGTMPLCYVLPTVVDHVYTCLSKICLVCHQRYSKFVFCHTLKHIYQFVTPVYHHRFLLTLPIHSGPSALVLIWSQLTTSLVYPK